MLTACVEVDRDGNVCISILHEPGADKWGYEKASERWLPVHTVESILISVISMLADPNDQSPANVDAAVSAAARRPSPSAHFPPASENVARELPRVQEEGGRLCQEKPRGRLNQTCDLISHHISWCRLRFYLSKLFLNVPFIHCFNFQLNFSLSVRKF